MRDRFNSPISLAQGLRMVTNSAWIAVAGLTFSTSYVKSQPVCDPPQSGEYLLLVVTDKTEQQEKIKRSLPEDTNSNICRYISDTVTRVAGFRSPQLANEWAQYVRDVVGLPAYVVQASATSIPQATPPQSTPPSSGFNPQALGPGYAVLVDYFNKPEVAGQVKQALGKQVGLASYGQRPYLMAIYTTDQNTAASTLRTLNELGFWAILVDSRRVTLISPDVK